MVRNGKRHGKQAYRCKNCGKTFVETATSAIQYSHSSETVWNAVISDTVNGISIDETAENLDLTHGKVFNMRHKILFCIEQAMLAAPVESPYPRQSRGLAFMNRSKRSKILSR